jgi:hypothetical protein
MKDKGVVEFKEGEAFFGLKICDDQAVSLETGQPVVMHSTDQVSTEIFWSKL